MLTVLPLLFVVPDTQAATGIMPDSGDWSAPTQVTNNALSEWVTSGDDFMANVGYNLALGRLEIRIGDPDQLVLSTLENAGGGVPCALQLGTDNKWGVWYRDATTQLLKYISTADAGSTWTSPVAVGGVVSSAHYCDATELVNTGTLIVITQDSTGYTRVYRSADNGATWTLRHNLDGTTTTGWMVAMKPAANPLIGYRDSNGDHRLYSTADDGLTWQLKGTDSSCTSGYKRAPVVLDTGRMVSGCWRYSEARFYGAWSINGGASWSYVEGYFATQAYMPYYSDGIVTDGTNVWATIENGDTNTVELIGSSDGGLSWTLANIESGVPSWSLGSRFTATDGKFYFSAYDASIGADIYMTALVPGGNLGSGTGGTTGGSTGSDSSDPTGGGIRVKEFDVDPYAQKSMTNLYGFDHDIAGFTLITREGYDGNEVIRTFDGGTLAQLGTKTLTGSACGFYGVVAGEVNVGYKDCSGSSDKLEIRSRSLGVSQKPAGCNSDACPDTVTSLDEAGPLPDINRVHDLEGFTVDYESFEPGSISADSTILGFAYAAYNDEFGTDIGVFGKFTLNNGDDEGDNHILQAGFTPASTAADGLCTWIDTGSNLRYIAAASQDTGIKSWLIDFNDDRGAIVGAGVNDIDISSSVKWTSGGSASGAHALACSRDTIFYSTGSKVQAVNQNTGVVKWSVFDSAEYGALTVSGNGEILYYVNDEQAVALDAEDGLVLATGNITTSVTGGIIHLGTTFAGGTLWLADGNGLSAYDFEKSTCVLQCGYNPNPDSDGDGISDAEQAGQDDDSGSGTTNSGGTVAVESDGILDRLVDAMSPTTRFIFSLLVIALCAGAAYKLAGPAPMVVGGAATLGLAFAVAVLQFPVWVPIVIAFSGLSSFAFAISKRVAG